MRMHTAIFVLSVLIAGGAGGAAQTTPEDRERARIQNRLGWENMKVEAWDEAAKNFTQAVEIDPEYEYAHYGLGRANMARKKYGEAIAALARCRDLFRAQAGRQFSNAQDKQRLRNDRLLEIDEQMRYMQSLPQNARGADIVRQLQNQRRDIQDAIQRGASLTIETSVPAYVYLSLGSAYFRAGLLADAEREYKATVAADSHSGEALQNLAVVYMETGRYADAERSIAAAKKVGFKVNPRLEDDIKARKKSGS